MSSISSLLGSIPSLASYLSGSSSGSTSSGTSTNTAASVADVLSGKGTSSLADYMGTDTLDGDTVSISSTAQTMLAQLRASASSSSASSSSSSSGDTTTSVAGGADDFISRFLKEAGVDTANLSDEVKSFIKGLGKVVGGIDGATRDSNMDAMINAASKGERQSYTLSGDNQRLSFTVQYKDGKPSSMTVLQVKGQRADTALLTFGADSSGAASTLNIARMSREYNSFGGQVSSQSGESSTLGLYA